MKRRPTLWIVTLIAVAAFAALIGARADTAKAGESPALAASTGEEAPAPELGTVCPRCGAPCPLGREGFRGNGARGGRHAMKGRRHGGMRGEAGRGQGRGLAAQRMIMRAKDLNLSDDQVKALEKLAFDAHKQMIDLRADLQKERLELQRQMQSDSDDLAAMKRHVNVLAQKRASIEELKLENLVAARKVLTDEQRKKIRDERPRMGRFFD